MAVLYHKTKIVLNSPIYVGFSVLELSKTLMYNFYKISNKKMFFYFVLFSLESLARSERPVNSWSLARLNARKLRKQNEIKKSQWYPTGFNFAEARPKPGGNEEGGEPMEYLSLV
jgi:hypothetical protein